MSAINPDHYKQYPVECIEIIEGGHHLLSTAIKYIWRAGDKDDYNQDIQKALWYWNRYQEYTSKKPYPPLPRFEQLESVMDKKKYAAIHALLSYWYKGNIEEEMVTAKIKELL